MNKAFIVFGMLLMTAQSATAGALTHKLSSSVQLTVDAAATKAVRIGSTFSVSGNGVNTTDGTNAGTVSAGTITSGVYSPGTISATQATNGNSFSFSQAYTAGDAIPAAAVTVGDVANFGDLTSTTAGNAGALAGTVGTTGNITVTAGGAGTTAIGQFVSEISIFD